MTATHKKNRGFSLMELMTIIAIISILSAVATPLYMNYREKARIAECRTELETIEAAITDLTLDTTLWPGAKPAGINPGSGVGNEIWDFSDPDAGLVATDGDFPNWNGPYLNAIPRDPWGHPYFMDYDYAIDGQDYVVIGSFGPNGVGQNVYDDDNIILIMTPD
jgi:prepilin-type N-terminal cleavage/methylation domain-containing protein